jgi:hypothetical protein
MKNANPFQSFEAGLRRQHRAVTAAEIEAGLAVPAKPRKQGKRFDRRKPEELPEALRGAALDDDGRPGLEVTLSVRIGSRALPASLYMEFATAAHKAGRDPGEIVAECIREFLAGRMPASMKGGRQ